MPVAHQFGVDETGRQRGLPQSRQEEKLVASRRFQEDEPGVKFFEAVYKFLDAGLGIGVAKGLVTGGNGHIQATLGDIDAHKAISCGHDQV